MEVLLIAIYSAIVWLIFFKFKLLPWTTATAVVVVSDASQWRDQPCLVVGTLDVAIHLRAEEPLRERMVGVASDANGASILHRHEHGARVRTVVRTGAPHHAIEWRCDVECGARWRGHGGEEGECRNLPRPNACGQAERCQ